MKLEKGFPSCRHGNGGRESAPAWLQQGEGRSKGCFAPLAEESREAAVGETGVPSHCGSSEQHPVPVSAGSPPTWDSLCSWVQAPFFLQVAAGHVAVLGSPASLLGPNSGADSGAQQGHSFKQVPLTWPSLHRALCLPGQREVKYLSPNRIVVQVKGSARSFKEAFGSSQKKKQVAPAAHRNSNCSCVDRVVLHETEVIGDKERHRSQKPALIPHFFQMLLPHSQACTQQGDNTAQRFLLASARFQPEQPWLLIYSADVNQWNVSMIFPSERMC